MLVGCWLVAGWLLGLLVAGCWLGTAMTCSRGSGRPCGKRLPRARAARSPHLAVHLINGYKSNDFVCLRKGTESLRRDGRYRDRDRSGPVIMRSTKVKKKTQTAAFDMLLFLQRHAARGHLCDEQDPVLPYAPQRHLHHVVPDAPAQLERACHPNRTLTVQWGKGNGFAPLCLRPGAATLGRARP